jgi:uridylate kinase
MFDKSICREEKAHYMGMIATIINSIGLQEALLKYGVDTEIHSLLSCPSVAKNYSPVLSNKVLNQGKVVILAGGTGKPFFTTDTGAAKNASELKMD